MVSNTRTTSAIIMSSTIKKTFYHAQVHDCLNQTPNTVPTGPFWQSGLKEILTSARSFSLVLFPVLFPASFVGYIYACLTGAFWLQDLLFNIYVPVTITALWQLCSSYLVSITVSKCKQFPGLDKSYHHFFLPIQLSFSPVLLLSFFPHFFFCFGCSSSYHCEKTLGLWGLPVTVTGPHLSVSTNEPFHPISLSRGIEWAARWIFGWLASLTYYLSQDLHCRAWWGNDRQ